MCRCRRTPWPPSWDCRGLPQGLSAVGGYRGWKRPLRSAALHHQYRQTRTSGLAPAPLPAPGAEAETGASRAGPLAAARYRLTRYRGRRERAPCGAWFAWESTDSPACTRICAETMFVVSCATSALAIWLCEAERLVSATARLLMLCSSRFWKAPRLARCVFTEFRALSTAVISAEALADVCEALKLLSAVARPSRTLSQVVPDMSNLAKSTESVL